MRITNALEILRIRAARNPKLQRAYEIEKEKFIATKSYGKEQMERGRNERSTEKHPWDAFLEARYEAMKWLRDSQKNNNKQIAETLSMDQDQVWAIFRAHDAS